MSVGLVTGLAVVLPLAGALLILLLGRWPNVREGVSLVTAGALLTLVLRLVDPVKAGLRPELVLVEVMPGIPLALRVEPLGLVFALVASFLWIVTTLYSIGYMRSHHEENQTRFFAFFAISIAAAMGSPFRQTCSRSSPSTRS